MEFASSTGEQEYAAVVRAADDLVVGLDFDGTLSPIVDDPEQAHIHPDAGEVLADLAAQVRAVAVVTGRPARQALDLGGLEEVGNAIGESGRELFVLGQYGNERWTSTDRRVISPKPPRGLATFMGGLPRLLRDGDAAGAWVEEKGLAVAVHTRRLDDPQAAFERLLPVLTEAARSHDLDVEPGRAVIEVRAPGMHKGAAVRDPHRGARGARPSCSAATTSATSRRSRPSRSCAGRSSPACSSARARRSRTRSPSWPTWWSTAPAAYSSCCGSSPTTSGPSAPEPDLTETAISDGGIDVHILRRLPTLEHSSSRGTEGNGPLKSRQPPRRASDLIGFVWCGAKSVLVREPVQGR